MLFKKEMEKRSENLSESWPTRTAIGLIGIRFHERNCTRQATQVSCVVTTRFSRSCSGEQSSRLTATGSHHRVQGGPGARVTSRKNKQPEKGIVRKGLELRWERQRSPRLVRDSRILTNDGARLTRYPKTGIIT